MIYRFIVAFTPREGTLGSALLAHLPIRIITGPSAKKTPKAPSLQLLGTVESFSKSPNFRKTTLIKMNLLSSVIRDILLKITPKMAKISNQIRSLKKTRKLG
jgi:hypothetical protein